MKMLLIFPPQWLPFSPHYAIPSLVGQFEGSDYDVSALDINLEFYYHVLDKKFILNSLKKAKELENELFNEISSFYVRSKKLEEYPLEQRNKITKHIMIKKFLHEHKNQLYVVPELVEWAIQIIKSKSLFYNPKLLLQSFNIIETALQIVSMPYNPTIINLSGYQNQNFKLNFDNIKYYVFDKDTNIFIDFYKTKLAEIQELNADAIGISINAASQIIPGLTLANILKNNTNAHINIGGNYFSRLTETLEKYTEFFDLFCDSISIEEGEAPILEFADFIAGKRTIDKVSNLMYLKDNQIVTNPKVCPMKLNDMKPPSFNGYNLDKYLTPSVVMPFQASRGCYWHKCSFCDHDFGLKYNVKSVDILIEQIKLMRDKYNINKFEFTDEAISPAYLEEFSKRVTEEGLDIRFFFDARLESAFSKDLMKLAYKAGLRMVMWGLESGSKKIMDLINKGVDFEDRINVLRNSHDAGIFNCAFIFFGFPSETKEDALKTIDLICDNKNIINGYAKSIFTMGKHSAIRENPEKYGVVGEIFQEEEFSPTYTFTASGMTKEELQEVVDICRERGIEAYGNGLIFQFKSREPLFLYIDKYGSEWVEKYKYI